MPKRLLYSLAAILVIVSATVLIWQGSFPGNFGGIAPEDPEQTFIFYGISIVIFLLMMTLGFMLMRLMIKLWIDRRADRPGSRIRTKLVFGALLLSLMPVFFMVFFSVYVLSATLQRWFSRPTEHELVDLTTIAVSLDRETRAATRATGELVAARPEMKALLEPAPGRLYNNDWLGAFCQAHGLSAALISRDQQPLAAWGALPKPTDQHFVTVSVPLPSAATLTVASPVPFDIVTERSQIEKFHREFNQLSDQRKLIRHNYLQLLTLIAFFVLFVATWLAQFLARQISGPISALLHAAEEVSRGNLSYRVNVVAMDELARLVEGFNRMTADLEASRAELESRRRFTEAILESIPTGVISVDSLGNIERVNKALEEIFPDKAVRSATRLDGIFPREDAAEIRYLINRARRTGFATRQLEIRAAAEDAQTRVANKKTLHLAVTVAAIKGGRNSGFVVLIEDTSDLLQAQKTAAWSEVARRVAHEIRNPLTPITLSAERIIRQANRAALPPAMDKALRECASTILDETASVKRLVDEFSQFARLPAAVPVPCDINEAVMSGLGVFESRLDGIPLQVDLAPDLPRVLIDPEQIKRVVVNLVDNAAEAMADSPSRELNVRTRSGETDSVEIIVTDTGPGITPEQKEKLFLPYFSTKGRGTGLGLAIVSHILQEHKATIRVEDNKPCGAIFIVEIPAAGVESGGEERLAVNDAAVLS